MMHPTEPTADDQPLSPGGYSRNELTDMVQRMHRVASAIYPMLTSTGCHPFVEFCGLMMKYVDVCRAAANSGIQFPFASTHSETALPVQTHDIAYMVEKLDCIFGPIIRANPAARAEFAKLLREPSHGL